MSNSSFSGPVRSKNGFKHYSVNATTGVETETEIVNSSGELVADFTPAVETAEHGAGAISTAFAPRTYRWTEAGVIITQIKFDLTGLGCVGTAANDVIGLPAGGVAYIGRNVVATNGVIFAAELACIETPGEGTATITGDIDIATNSSGTLEYDGAAGAGKLINGGTLVAGQSVANAVPALTANDYYYIVEADTAATTGVYNAGQFILTTYGHALMT